ncbi:YesL family protein [Aquibacillus albus]|uniref:Membrane protein YesL n=1 Tax=Aquibacillus albus TaxID=1168171 RepID=A0ABS2MW10_9BACI|nr:YesL family protein [Aquibacillus albus]MBM7570082.1 putative membrane protein YesL [Aquibacillus albus]
MNTGPMWGFYRVCVWIMNFVYLNILWMAFTLLGLVFFGFAPATVSLFAVVRKWIQGYTDVPIFKSFWRNYKKEFFKSNVIGLILSVFGYILYVDFQLVLHSANSTIQQITYLPLLLLILTYTLTLLYVFPVYVHYEVNILQVLKNAFIIMIMRPLNTIMLIAGTAVVYYVLRFVPGLIPFLSMSLWAYVMMWCSNLVFKRIEEKQEQVKSESAAI